MMDKIVLHKDSVNGFYVYQLEYNKWQVRSTDGRIVGNAASLEQVEGTMQRKMHGYPFLLYLHTAHLFNVPKRVSH
jgi:hypothetical protein